MSSTNAVSASTLSKVSTHDFSLSSRVGCEASCLATMSSGSCGCLGHQVREMARDELVCFQIEIVHAPLRVLADLVEVRFRASVGRIQGHDARVVVIRPVDRARPESEDEAQHPRLRVDVLTPDVGVERETDAGHVREEVPSVHRAGDAQHEQRHLFVAVQKWPPGAVLERLLAHGAGVDRANGGEEILQPLFAGALVGAEDALVLAGERIAEIVLEQASSSGR